ncbi:MAG: tRNA uridine-5-carboxymethylaminomethyl(34) synthesis GTPase MnmE [Verrucomicrobia bacterium]|nr:tRNA uridine-5-carboxymethylaminomethyl(34) synthesis GTPase MnmE [Verrucomicrobiota bacterium]
MTHPLDSSSTIAAVATPFGEGAIALLRVSGPQAIEIVGRVCQPANGRPLAALASRRQHRAQIFSTNDAAPLDDVLVALHRAPRSYTGEDLVELTCHGGILLTQRVLETLLAAGAQPARPGEFTERAFLHGKLDLTQAEAVMDVISAGTDLALRAAREQLAGRLGARVGDLRADLLGLVAHLEAYIDFPDEDIDPDTGAKFLARLDAALATLDALLATADQGRILREGVRTVIFGEPNVGKSSLLNALVGHDRAIVSPTPGTTRDTIEEFINVRGLPLRLIDTAGLRESADAVERAGIARTRQSLAQADLAQHVVDASQSSPTVKEINAEPLPDAPASLLIFNKIDLGLDPCWNAPKFAGAIRVSCRTGAGLDALADAIYATVTGGQVAWNPGAAAINARHQDCLRRARAALVTAREALTRAEPPEIVALELRAALDAIGEVIGGADTEEILGEIFAKFCIGK